ncbi:unnamed protein product [Dicrocoelium dendriticum]|nr:unnamed protein product [Dicrocoelium dendriticum]
MACTSVSIIPLTYLGNSVLKQTPDDQLTTIYELLFTYYLDFLHKTAAREKQLRTYADVMSDAYSTVVLAVGGGQLVLRFIGTEKCGEQTFRKHLEKTFTSEELVYFNCYSLEVVIQEGRGKKKCFAYFRRAIDTRRCVPEDALLRLDDSLSVWLLRNRHVPRPPLIYFIVFNKIFESTLICHAFLAGDLQLGLQALRLLAELRRSVFRHISGADDLDVPTVTCKYCENVRIPGCEACVHLHPVSRTRARSSDSRLCHSTTTTCANCLSRNVHKHQDCATSVALCHHPMYLCHLNDVSWCALHDNNYRCAFCEHLFSEPSTSDTEDQRKKKLQMKLGREAADYYRRRRRQFHSAHTGRGKTETDLAAPSLLTSSLQRTSTPDLVMKKDPISTSYTANKVKNVSSSLAITNSKTKETETSHPFGASSRRRPTRSAEGRSVSSFQNTSLAMLP